MQVSSRARLAWANRNLEEAADIIVADHLRDLDDIVQFDDVFSLTHYANILDPEGDDNA